MRMTRMMTLPKRIERTRMERPNEFDEIENVKREEERERRCLGTAPGSRWILGEKTRVMPPVPTGPHSCTMLEQNFTLEVILGQCNSTGTKWTLNHEIRFGILT